MRFYISFIIVCLTFFLFSCATMNVRSDYDTEFNFSQFKTYKIVNKTSSKAEAKLPTSLGFIRISRAVEKDFNKKGFIKKEIEPDFIVTFHTSVEKKLSVETTNHRRWGGAWIAEHEVREYRQGLLVMDVVNRVTKNVVWRGWAKGFDENNGASQDEMDEIVFNMLSLFPPVPKN